MKWKPPRIHFQPFLPLATACAGPPGHRGMLAPPPASTHVMPEAPLPKRPGEVPQVLSEGQSPGTLGPGLHQQQCSPGSFPPTAAPAQTPLPQPFGLSAVNSDRGGLNALVLFPTCVSSRLQICAARKEALLPGAVNSWCQQCALCWSLRRPILLLTPVPQHDVLNVGWGSTPLIPEGRHGRRRCKIITARPCRRGRDHLGGAGRACQDT